jgi:hypothetical protein
VIDQLAGGAAGTVASTEYGTLRIMSR